jgi:hypothetical protein
MDVAIADQLGQLVARLSAASPTVGVIVDTDLVRRRDIDPAEPVGHPANVDGTAIPHERIGSEAWAGRENQQDRNEPTHDRTV